MTTSDTTTQAVGTFSLDSWEQEPYHDGADTQLWRAHNTKTWSGDLTGTSTGDLMLVSVPVPGADEFAGVAYVGVERFDGALGGRSGTFVFTHLADRASGMVVSVVEGSASGELTGLTGKIQISKDENDAHTYTFDYALG